MTSRNKMNSKQRKLNSVRKIKWFGINWRLANAQVKQYQKEIAVAYRRGDLHKVKLLQHKLVNSFARKRIAVKTVSSNKGKNTPGIDNVIWNTPETKY
jgi:RNA-directed DNA polymerase